MKKNRFIPMVILVLVILLLGCLAYTHFTNQSRRRHDGVDFISDVPSVYYKLNKSINRRTTSFPNAMTCNGRSPIAFMLFDNDYDLLMYKVGDIGQRSLKDVVQFTPVNSIPSKDRPYYNVPMADFDLWLAPGKSDSVVTLDMRYNGDNFTSAFMNDTLLCYNMDCSRFSMSINRDPVGELIGESIQATKYFSFALLKKDNGLFLLLCTPGKGRDVFDKNKLCNTLTN